jgi:hypothetical protein
MRTVLLSAVVGFAALLVLAAGAGAHGGDPADEAAALNASMKRPVVIRTTKSRVVLGIAHVTKGCHVWTFGKRSAPGAKLVVRRGARLTVVNRDVDRHRLAKLSGPAVSLGKAMGINERVTVVFRKKGTYRLKTIRTEIEGIPKLDTIGVDNALAMVVVVR